MFRGIVISVKNPFSHRLFETASPKPFQIVFRGIVIIMVTTLTLNPCIDKTVTTKKFCENEVNRVKISRCDLGGKGINVSRALINLGVSTCACGINFSQNGDFLISTLDRLGIKRKFVEESGTLRTNLKIFDEENKRTVEINEAGGYVHGDKLDALKKIIASLAPQSEIFVLAGSVPDGVRPTVYLELSKLIKSENPECRVILDADGELLLNGALASPFMIKPNIYELEAAFGFKCKTADEIVKAARKIIAQYKIGVVLVSMGADGAVIVSENEAFETSPVKVDVKGVSGAGDSMVAGACLAIKKGLSLSQVLQYAVCAAGASIMREGTLMCEQSDFLALLDKAKNIKKAGY